MTVKRVDKRKRTKGKTKHWTKN